MILMPDNEIIGPNDSVEDFRPEGQLRRSKRVRQTNRLFEDHLSGYQEETKVLIYGRFLRKYYYCNWQV